MNRLTPLYGTFKEQVNWQKRELEQLIELNEESSTKIMELSGANTALCANINTLRQICATRGRSGRSSQPCDNTDSNVQIPPSPMKHDGTPYLVRPLISHESAGIVFESSSKHEGNCVRRDNLVRTRLWSNYG